MQHKYFEFRVVPLHCEVNKTFIGVHEQSKAKKSVNALKRATVSI
jgi:hypothetical protein